MMTLEMADISVACSFELTRPGASRTFRCMGHHVALRDKRLTGKFAPSGRLDLIDLDAHVSLQWAFSELRTKHAMNGRIRTLFILCHGFAGQNSRAGVCMDAGGEGLQLGMKNVTHGNVQDWAAVKGMIRDIVVYSCAAANTERGNEFSRADGKYLMGALALHTQSTVYAADVIQWYNPAGFDFGAWEGQLYQFRSNGEPGRKVGRPPVEMRAVVNGTAI